MGNFIWGRVYGLGKIGRGKVYDSLQEYSPLTIPMSYYSWTQWLKILLLSSTFERYLSTSSLPKWFVGKKSQTHKTRAKKNLKYSAAPVFPH